MADMPHYCSACGEVHGGHSGETEAIKIAKINADRDIEVARIARSETRQELEAATEQTAIEAEAQVAEAVVEAAVLEEIVTPEPQAAPELEPETEPEVIVADAPESDDVPPPPESEPAKEPKSSGGYWSGYSAT